MQISISSLSGWRIMQMRRRNSHSLISRMKWIIPLRIAENGMKIFQNGNFSVFWQVKVMKDSKKVKLSMSKSLKFVSVFLSKFKFFFVHFEFEFGHTNSTSLLFLFLLFTSYFVCSVERKIRVLLDSGIPGYIPFKKFSDELKPWDIESQIDEIRNKIVGLYLLIVNILL